MRTLAAILIVLLSITGVVYLAGRMQPEQHMVTQSAVIAAPAADVWKRINDVPSEPSWRHSVKSVRPDAPQDGLPCYTEDLGITLHVCVQRTDGERLRIVSVNDTKQNFDGTWTFLVQPGDATQPNGNTTRLTITEDASVHNVFWRGAMVITGMDRNIRGYLKDLSRSFSGAPEQS